MGGVAFSGEVSWPDMEKLKDTIQNSLKARKIETRVSSPGLHVQIISYTIIQLSGPSSGHQMCEQTNSPV